MCSFLVETHEVERQLKGIEELSYSEVIDPAKVVMSY